MSDIPSYIGKIYINDEKLIESDASKMNTDMIVRQSELPKNARVIFPDSMVTMDFDEKRINLHLDKDNTVIRQRMG